MLGTACHVVPIFVCTPYVSTSSKNVCENHKNPKLKKKTKKKICPPKIFAKKANICQKAKKIP
jgi:hypothetical protein